MSHMCIDAATRAASDLGYRTTVVHDACATRDLEFDGQVVPAAQVHNAYMSALAFAYAKVTTADEYLDAPADRKSVVAGKRVSVRVDLGGRRISQKKTQTKE